MECIILMTLSGSYMFVGYLAWEKLFGKRTTQGMRYKALKVVLLGYLIPWSWIRAMYRHILLQMQTKKTAVSAERTVSLGRISLLFVIFWLVIAISLVIVRTVKFLKKSYALRFLAVECEDRNLEEVSERLQKEKLYNRRVRIVWTRGENDTMTVGILRPIILLQKKYEEGKLYWILKHEMIHVNKQDLLEKCLMEFARCLHWINPLIYVVNRRLAFLSETSCDERVIMGCTEEERRGYAELLDKSRKESCARAPKGCSLKKFSEDIDRRMELIMEGERAERKQKAAATVIFGLIVLMEALLVLLLMSTFVDGFSFTDFRT